MHLNHRSDLIVPHVCVPRSLLAHPDRFGGTAVPDVLCGDLVIRDGRVLGLQKRDGRAHRLLMPKLTECHVHLDKCHTISRMQGVGGDLQAAINAQAADRKGWSAADIRERADRGLSELVAAGCMSVRTHVDWSHGADATIAPRAWYVLCDLAANYRNQIRVQISPLIGIDDLANSVTADAIARLVKPASPVLGAFVLDQPDRGAGILNAFHVAERYGLALDFHVDEGLSDGLDGLELIANAAIETGFEGPVLCGHACSMMNLSGEALKRLTDKIARTNMTIAALPTTNLYLQGRTDGTPDHRGITRLRELRAADVPVAVGTDNVCDAFCPLGRHDPRHSLALSVLAAHLDPPFGAYLPMITTNAEQALGLAPTHVDGAAIGDLLLFDATSTSDLLANPDRPRRLSDVLKGELT